MAFKSYPEQWSCGNICNRLEKSGASRVWFKFNKIFLGTDGAASSRVGQILLFRVEGSIPYSAPLNQIMKYGQSKRFGSLINVQSYIKPIHVWKLWIKMWERKKSGVLSILSNHLQVQFKYYTLFIRKTLLITQHSSFVHIHGKTNIMHSYSSTYPTELKYCLAYGSQ